MFLLFRFDPPNWQEGTMMQCGMGDDNYFLDGEFKFEDIAPKYLPALQKVVEKIVSSSQEWQATQVWATKSRYKSGEVDSGKIDAEGQPIMQAVYSDCIELKVEAVHSVTKKTGIFTSENYDILRVTDADALEFFAYYSKTVK